MTQKQQSTIDFFCEFNKGCSALCSLCPNREVKEEVFLVPLTLEEIRALIDNDIPLYLPSRRINQNSALQKLEQIYKEKIK